VKGEKGRGKAGVERERGREERKANGEKELGVQVVVYLMVSRRKNLFVPRQLARKTYIQKILVFCVIYRNVATHR
jgi:hypothetical protein